MSNEAAAPVTATEGDPSVTIMPGAAPAPAPAPKADAKAPNGDPDWLAARLDQAKRSVLKELGVDTAEAAKSAIAAAKAADEAKKSDAQKLAEYEGKIATQSASVDALTKTVSAFAQSQLAALTDAQRAAVTAIAGDDPSKQLSALDALKPTWATAPAPAPAPVATPVIANSGPPAKSAPSDHGTPRTAPLDHKAVYAEIKAVNPIKAAQYAVQHGIFN